MKNIIESLNNIPNHAKERISDLTGKKFKVFSKGLKRKAMQNHVLIMDPNSALKKKCYNKTDKMITMYTLRILTKNFTNFEKEANILVQQRQRSLIKFKYSLLRNITIKLLKIKKNNSKATKEKNHVLYKGVII